MDAARRWFLTGAPLAMLAPAVASVAYGQRGPKVYRIGVLSSQGAAVYITPFIVGLHELGWAEGVDFKVERRITDTTPGSIEQAARELVAQNVDVVVTAGTGHVAAAIRASEKVPIVMIASGYPVEVGLVKSYARPGGNVTGNSIYVGVELFGKHLEILKALLPRMRRLAVFWNWVPPYAYVGEGELALEELKRSATALSIDVRVWETRRPEDLAMALSALSKEYADALYVSGGGVHGEGATRIAEFARRHRLATITDSPALFRAAEILMTYSANPAKLARQAATFVDRILRGAHPSELPIERPLKLDLIINLKTAKALGLSIPPSLLLRADQIIE